MNKLPEVRLIPIKESLKEFITEVGEKPKRPLSYNAIYSDPNAWIPSKERMKEGIRPSFSIPPVLTEDEIRRLKSGVDLKNEHGRI